MTADSLTMRLASRRRANWQLNAALGALLLVLFLVSVGIGYVSLSLGDTLAALTGTAGEKLQTIVWELRLPRTLLSMAIGSALGLAGAVLQGLLRNPLAEPGIIGISSSAGLGAVIALYFGWSMAWPLALPASAMAGAAIATIILYIVAARSGSVLTLILLGVAISGFAISLSSLAMNLSPNPWAVSEILFWLMGSVKDRSFYEVNLALPFILIGSAVLMSSGRALDALSLGEEGAQSLGVDLRRLRVLAIVGTSAAVGAGVAVAGTIGFVGLVVPHLLRPVTGHMPSRLLLPSALAGACLLTAADIGVRLLANSGPELHLGVVTSLIGAPFFFYLLFKVGGSMR
ncbi:iron complex transport system permease protein [Parvibaculum indicum]|uniref:FecCD family ABC transporter permease n=1 Tax=Parvibaculum indicum TaxID=562969 RepID=UPI0031B59CEE|nr:iron complex transport system permease protein [Parvibaculum indicum]